MGGNPQILSAVLDAHAKSARRENASTVAVLSAYGASGNYIQAIAAGLMTLGFPHGPVKQAYEFLFTDVRSPKEKVADYLGSGRKIPGWGNSFFSGKPDPDWTEVDRLLSKDYPEISALINNISVMLNGAGKNLWPNPACYTACAAKISGLPAEVSAYIFLEGRLFPWTQLIVQNYAK